MDPGSRLLQSAHVSQTQLEQRDLIQYECNLAACYEAEYLLSLKIQEEMCHQKDAYNDPSEVTYQFGTGSCAPASGANMNDVHSPHETAMDCSHGDRVGQFLPGFLSSSESGHSRPLLIAEHSAANVCGQEYPRFSHRPAGAAADMDTSQSLSRARDECGASEDHLMHHDGPSRKKICLNRAEY